MFFLGSMALGLETLLLFGHSLILRLTKVPPAQSPQQWWGSLLTEHASAQSHLPRHPELPKLVQSHTPVTFEGEGERSWLGYGDVT